MSDTAISPTHSVQVFRTPYPHLLIEVLRARGIEAVCEMPAEIGDDGAGGAVVNSRGEPGVDPEGHLLHVAAHDAPMTESLAARNHLPLLAQVMG